MISKFKHLLPTDLIDGTFQGTYYEPFVGSGAVFLYLEPKKWVINDLNTDLINCWKLVQNEPENIITAYKKLGAKLNKMSDKRKKTFCQELTEQVNKMKPNDNHRTLIIMLMKSCAYMGNIFFKDRYKFPGLELNFFKEIGCGAFKSLFYNKVLDVSKYMQCSKGKFLNGDYSKAISYAKQGDFVFLDPPYFEKNVDYQFKYNKNEDLSINFYKNLKKECDKLTKKGVKFMLTHADTKEIKLLFKKYNIDMINVFRPKRKAYVNELIITNYS
jgi:DNA adenine methylase